MFIAWFVTKMQHQHLMRKIIVLFNPVLRQLWKIVKDTWTIDASVFRLSFFSDLSSLVWHPPTLSCPSWQNNLVWCRFCTTINVIPGWYPTSSLIQASRIAFSSWLRTWWKNAPVKKWSLWPSRRHLPLSLGRGLPPLAFNPASCLRLTIKDNFATLFKKRDLGCLLFTQTTLVEILCININYKIWRGGRETYYNVYRTD